MTNVTSANKSPSESSILTGSSSGTDQEEFPISELLQNDRRSLFRTDFSPDKRFSIHVMGSCPAAHLVILNSGLDSATEMFYEKRETPTIACETIDENIGSVAGQLAAEMQQRLADGTQGTLRVAYRSDLLDPGYGTKQDSWTYFEAKTCEAPSTEAATTVAPGSSEPGFKLG